VAKDSWDQSVEFEIEVCWLVSTAYSVWYGLQAVLEMLSSVASYDDLCLLLKNSIHVLIADAVSWDIFCSIETVNARPLYLILCPYLWPFGPKIILTPEYISVIVYQIWYGKNDTLCELLHFHQRNFVLNSSSVM